MSVEGKKGGLELQDQGCLNGIVWKHNEEWLDTVSEQ